MKKLLFAILFLAGCNDGSRTYACYGNHTCDPGMQCVWLRTHGSACVKDDDVQLFVNGQWRNLLPDGGAK